jgi:hypothetical protein
MKTYKQFVLEDPPSISPERQRILTGFGQPQSPAEREFQIAYAEHCGLSGPMTYPKLEDNNDYEGAILARQEADYI